VRILAVIPARGGSKRLPGKNVRPLGGKPLLAWSIDVVRNIPEICDTLVSTDDAAIAEVGRASGASVPWLRPAELATDTATSVDVCLHALDRYESAHGAVDGLLLLQPTSPFRTRDTVRRALEMFRTDRERPVVSVSPVTSHPFWCFFIMDDRMRPCIDARGLDARSQDLPAAYALNGAIYLVTPAHLRKDRSFCSDRMAPLVMTNPAESIDIDTEWDWQIAELLLTRHQRDDCLE
jgi:CMP-N,N'-diacetyllegionaminic acid synthase